MADTIMVWSEAQSKYVPLVAIKGEDGFSPIVETETAANGDKILRITDASGEKELVLPKYEVQPFTVNLPAAQWVGIEAPYSLALQVQQGAIAQGDNPLVTPVYSDSNAVAVRELAAWQCICQVITRDGELEFKAFDTKPDTDLTLLVEVVR